MFFFRTRKIVVFEDQNDIINNDTIREDEVVVLFVTPRYLLDYTILDYSLKRPQTIETPHPPYPISNSRKTTSFFTIGASRCKAKRDAA